MFREKPTDAEHLVQSLHTLYERATRLGLTGPPGTLTAAQLDDLEEDRQIREKLWERGDMMWEDGKFVWFDENKAAKRLEAQVDRLIKALDLKYHKKPEPPPYKRVATSGGNAGAQGSSWTGRVLHSTRSLGG